MFVPAADVVITAATKNLLIQTHAKYAADRSFALIARVQAEFTDKEILFFNFPSLAGCPHQSIGQ